MKLLDMACSSAGVLLACATSASGAAVAASIWVGNAKSMAPALKLGGPSPFKATTVDALAPETRVTLGVATTRFKDLEIAWDGAEPRLKSRASNKWRSVDRAIARALPELRATTPNAETNGQSLKDLRAVIDAAK